jgi:hypothetical protein
MLYSFHLVSWFSTLLFSSRLKIPNLCRKTTDFSFSTTDSLSLLVLIAVYTLATVVLSTWDLNYYIRLRTTLAQLTQLLMPALPAVHKTALCLEQSLCIPTLLHRQFVHCSPFSWLYCSVNTCHSYQRGSNLCCHHVVELPVLSFTSSNWMNKIDWNCRSVLKVFILNNKNLNQFRINSESPKIILKHNKTYIFCLAKTRFINQPI